MNTYWHKHPRGFANECIALRAETNQDAEFLRECGFTRLTREELRRHVRWINAENDAWGSNNAFGRGSFRSIVSASEDICNNGYPAHAASEYIKDLNA